MASAPISKSVDVEPSRVELQFRATADTPSGDQVRRLTWLTIAVCMVAMALAFWSTVASIALLFMGVWR